MVKDLILVRHAEAAQAVTGVKDIERELTAKGYRDAPRVGRYLHENAFFPDMIISSTALRAKSTAELLAEQLKYELNQISYDEDLYNASIRTLLSAVNASKATLNKLLLVGHNPALSYLAEYLTGDEIGNMEPAAFAHIQFKLDDWSAISENTGTCLAYKTPENTIF
jgi:phosphohistidine phosphatase